ncbi:hypothetical protein [Pedobacter africanus]|uniref:Uncharacterized protein n=1 Tax=Pedobacter africanus TaxID=151894 RepID=A0A1W1ZCP0_9SPHI|nr:hypothetical protein [Pedobacter africanus]SMC46137.1 hypothetical protein SAMN04488524_0600 [Pedobacter africanus]
MTIVDQYILDHRDEMNNQQMADKLGVSDEFVRTRKARLSLESQQLPVKLTITAKEEIYALVQFILQRKSGVLVDIAERRIKDINAKLSY